MGYDLINHKQMKMMNFDTWYRLLDLASVNGWKAAGTEPPEDSVGAWRGGYNYNDGQFVTRADAKAFATALRLALKRGVLVRNDDEAQTREIGGQTLDLLPEETKQKLRLARELFSLGDWGAFVEEIADFADEGGFQIW